jgi:hypothetical protein
MEKIAEFHKKSKVDVVAAPSKNSLCQVSKRPHVIVPFLSMGIKFMS